ncbi:uncharacterized protein LOC132038560 [Lycium ferocissimum]|uniref:uncharacterized protein LOC132038560 n=1 Tax=Lycium ferocissimum TaxID=112874 RepID=UPI00281679D7|nr:uncharacterized protein LOC132038560 [Lycium ferocissimum]
MGPLGEIQVGVLMVFLRNTDGNLIYAQAADIGITTNTDAEVMAIVEAMRYCRNEGLDNIIVQTNSEMIYKILEEGWKPLWGIFNWIEEILEIKNAMTVSFSHILRKGNKLADALANQALDKASLQCHNFQELPSMCRKILNSDKTQIPYLRIRTTR